MTEFDPQQFEVELQTLKPAKPSAQSLQRVRLELNDKSNAGETSRPVAETGIRWTWVFRWFAPAAGAVVAAACLLFNHDAAKIEIPSQPSTVSTASAIKADKVEIDRQFVGDFDAVTELPNGQPLRFRCEQWLDKVSLRDSASGLLIERTTPRVEIVPVRFDTY